MDGQTLTLRSDTDGRIRRSARPYDRITVIGMGAWGTALAAVAASAGREVRLWGRRADLARDINETRVNTRHLPDAHLPEGILALTDLPAALEHSEAVLLVTPSRTLRKVCAELRPYLPQGVPLVLCCKGIEQGTGYLLSHLVEEELPGHPVGALSGPTFAKETVLGHPTAATIAFEFRYTDRLRPEDSPAARLSVSMSSSAFRPYISDDLVGVEIGGAVKNVIAIACGMMTGAGFAENTRAALIARGMDEMKFLAEALGGRRETITGLSGAGDLTLTCSSTTSRNMSLGVQLGQGKARSECFDGKKVVVEGEVNAISVVDLARRIGVHMPICETVHAILHEGAALDESFTDLWARPLESEPRALSIELVHPKARRDPAQ
ncbi:NAD(P)-dependent glycerol-3-phosphate dehydrogenase [Roseivivax sp. GX 12232]|uniref:NAD(P)H-dependent glycerol-3-phosphate dehydrogenase n=1 Tax=Roseivivax sp. GX 12232 TaxID=2900547 RepID=UPI001E393482|nr:NAD(P)H-dependent glycerol-3-phosphate dehydrogenase [Roseivivax sp. GX 12232]MCE0504731.1 NAD(P)-dependent glycerol-3-phosphate dehydrogenase [Roseivivax sp. GX 12232]